MSTFLENQNWRYATKKFDATKKITTEEILLLSKKIDNTPYSVLYQRVHGKITAEDKQIIKSKYVDVNNYLKNQAALELENNFVSQNVLQSYVILFIICAGVSLAFGNYAIGLAIFIVIGLAGWLIKPSNNQVKQNALKRVSSLDDEEVKTTLYNKTVKQFEKNLRQLLTDHWTRFNRQKIEDSLYIHFDSHLFYLTHANGDIYERFNPKAITVINIVEYFKFAEQRPQYKIVLAFSNQGNVEKQEINFGYDVEKIVYWYNLIFTITQSLGSNFDRKKHYHSDQNTQKNHNKKRAYSSESDFNPYEVLEVTQDSAKEDIKRAYRNKASIFHPDKVSTLPKAFQKVAEDKMKEINKAYDLLK